ncbi:MAG: hypothetical protein Q4C54_07450 [Clostridia bacterium]|nr:hypothetical protein [Clostridia bacterium]
MKDSLLTSGRIDNQKILERIRALDPFHNRKYCRRDEMTVARLFSDIFGGIARYNTTAKSWFVYDGIKWKSDLGSMVVEDYAKRFATALLIYSADVSDNGYSQFVVKYGDRSKRMVMLDDARSYRHLCNADLDQHPELFNCQNCVINLDTLETLEHDPDMLLSKCANVIYDPSAESPEFVNFMNQVMYSDREKIRYIQSVLGYALTGSNTQE